MWPIPFQFSASASAANCLSFQCVNAYKSKDLVCYICYMYRCTHKKANGGSKSAPKIGKVLNIFYCFLQFQHNDKPAVIIHPRMWNLIQGIQKCILELFIRFFNSTRTHDTSISGSQFLLIDFNTKCTNFEYAHGQRNHQLHCIWTHAGFHLIFNEILSSF